MKKKLFTSFPVTSHTDYVTQGTTFVVIKGLKEDGSAYILQALERGATTVVVQDDTSLSAEILALIAQYGAQLVFVPDSRKALAQLSAQAAGYPAQKLKLFGVGGTKGKTTTVVMLAHLLKTLGKKVAFLSTALIGIDTGSDALAQYDCAGTLTTPQPDYLHQFLKLCVEKGVEYVVLEVAAQAHTFSRLETIAFDGVIFTNLDREHGELYPCMEQYFAEKQKLFPHVKKGGSLIVNGDDLYGQRLLEQYPYACSYGLKTDAHCHAMSLVDSLTDQCAQFKIQEKSFICTYYGFPGLYNLSNMLAAISLLAAQGFSVEKLSGTPLRFPAIPGRLELQQLKNGALAVIDYAHTAESIKQVLLLMRPRTRHLIVLFGAGGGKDSAKRPAMGKVAAQLADVVILTDDNPRHEDPQVITEQIFSGADAEHREKVMIIHDRAAAIQKAFSLSYPDTIIMLLGKGPDTEQIIKGDKLFFSERQLLQLL